MRTLTLFTASSIIALSMIAGTVAADVLSDRKDGFKAHADNIKAVKAAVESGNAADAVAPAEKMVAFAKQIDGLFPAGSGSGETRAKPEIWSDWAKFQEVSAAHVAETEKLVAVAKSGDASALGAQLKATGASCGACHKPFRLPKK